MKILFVAVFSSKSTNVSQADGFARNGHEVVRYDYRGREAAVGTVARNQEIVAAAVGMDLVVFAKAKGISPEVPRLCRESGAKVAYWWPDPIKQIAGYVHFMRECDVQYIALTEPYAWAKDRFPRVEFLQEGFDPLVDRPFDVPFVRDVAFIGAVEHRGDRKRLMEAVGAELIQGVFRENHAKTVCSTRINLNFTEGGTSDRTYKVLAAGGFLLTQRWPGMEKDFEQGRDFAVFDGVESLRYEIGYWLLNEERRLVVARQGCETVQKFGRDAWARRVAER